MDYFDEKFDKKMDIFLTIILIVLNIISAIIAISLATKVAYVHDVEPLKKQILQIQQNPDLLYKTDCDVDVEVKDEVITVRLENKKCELMVKFNENFEIISTKTHDKLNIFEQLIFALSSFFVIGCFFGGLNALFETIEEKKQKKNKNK